MNRLTNWISSCCECDFFTLLRITWLGATALVLLILVCRRLLGGLVEPLPFMPAFFVGCAITAYSYLFRLVFRQQTWCHFAPAQIDQKITVATAILLLTLTIPGTSSLTAIALWFPWITFELQWWCVRNEATPVTISSATVSVPPMSRSFNSIKEELSNDSEENDDDLIMQLRHVRSENSELISGHVQIDFAADQQIAVAHLAFCPPLPNDPEIMAEPSHGEPVTVRVSEVHTYGARIEVKRAASQKSPERIMVTFEAIADKAI